MQVHVVGAGQCDGVHGGRRNGAQKVAHATAFVRAPGWGSPRAGTGADADKIRADAMELSPLTALSPVDGRYAAGAAALRGVFSEYGLIRRRVQVEVRWLLALAAHPDIGEVPALGDDATGFLDRIVAGFSAADAQRIKDFEAITNHDVKAVEYFLAERCATHPELARITGFLHFACTSEDINNLAYGLMLCEARDVLNDALTALLGALADLAETHGATPMLARTHGQPATPTTLGKEMALFAHRLLEQRARFRAVRVRGKFNGATGNFNAHLAAYPDLDWMALSRSFVESLGLDWNPHTTQIEPHDGMAEYFQAVQRINTVVLDLCRDVWGYTSLGYFRQRPVPGEVGSSTMPHKVNPIDFENAEGNLGIANALLAHLAGKLPVSRWQRDLTDSTVQRSIGTALAHSLVAWRACLRGLGKLDVDPERMQQDLDASQEVLAEAVQTVMRRYGIPEPYEKLKQLTRGEHVDAARLAAFVRTLDLPGAARDALLALTPARFTGNAAAQAAAIAAAVRRD
jgi:adenylosuccinate lyase